MNDINSTDKSDLREQHRRVLAAITEFGPLTDAELADHAGMSVRSASPRRLELAAKGFVEQDGTTLTRSGRRAKRWKAVPDDRIGEVRAAAASRSPRKKPISSMPLPQKLAIVRQLLDDDEVNGAIKDQHGRAWSRVRGRSQSQRSERERERREINAAIREAERQNAPMVEFLKLKRHLLEGGETVRAIGRFVAEDLQRRANGQRVSIAEGQWPEVVDLLIDVTTAADETVREVQTMMGNLGDDAIEVDAIEIDDFYELPEGKTLE